MKHKIGDRVKFLTEQGGGIIRKIISPSMVSIETKDGFEIPTLIRDIILIESNSVSEHLFDKMEQNNDNEAVIEEQENTSKNNDFSLVDKLIVPYSERNAEKFCLNIAFVPHQQNMPIVGDIDIYIVNISNFDIFFSYNAINENIRLLSSGTVPAFSRFHIASIGRDELEIYLNANIQTLVLQNESNFLYSPISSEMQIRGSKFYKENIYVNYPFINQKAIVYKLFDFSNIPIINKLSGGAEDIEINKTKSVEHKKNDAILKHKTSKGEAVVDMHIWVLVDDFSKMTNSEMLDIQLRYFEKCLQSAIDNHFHSVVFIHGVGTGKLKAEIKEILDDKDFIKYFPASMAEYGVGATKVEIFYEN